MTAMPPLSREDTPCTPMPTPSQRKHRTPSCVHVPSAPLQTWLAEIIEKTPTITKRSRGRERAAARRDNGNAASSATVHAPTEKAAAEAEAEAGAEAEAEAIPPWKAETLAKRRATQASEQAMPSKSEALLGLGAALDLRAALGDLRVEMAAAPSSSKQLDCIEVLCLYPTACPSH